MFGIKKVLVGVDLVCADGSMATYELPPPTVEAVEIGLQIGVHSRAEILFFTVLPESDETEDNPAAQAVLDQLLAEATERNVPAASKITVGRGWMEIIREVLSGGQDLVLVGSRNHRTRQLLLGTTGTKLLRKCPCPVWVARPDTAPDVQTVLVAHDLTDVGRHCIELGVSAAKMLDAKLLVVHAVQYPLEPSLRRTECPPDEIEEYRTKQQDESRQVINGHLDQTDHRTLPHGVVVEVTHGPPDVVIHHAIEEHQVDLLVMGTVARSGIPGLLVGNTAERLLPEVECSILAVKPQDFESPVKPV